MAQALFRRLTRATIVAASGYFLALVGNGDVVRGIWNGTLEVTGMIIGHLGVLIFVISLLASVPGLFSLLTQRSDRVTKERRQKEVLDSLAKLKSLLDQGVLSQAEYDKKAAELKAEIL